jgi:hypothetical protein
LKRSYVIIGAILILASSFAIEYYTKSRFPTTDLVLVGVPELAIGEVNRYTCLRELEPVGLYSYTVTGKSDGIYTMDSLTDVSIEGKRLQLSSTFIFDEMFSPKHYLLTADQGGDINEFNVTFTENNVTSVVSFAGETITLSEELPDGAFLVENNMPGFWEIMLKSARLEEGKRYTAVAYIPQGGTMFDLEFFVNQGTKSITVDGVDLDCILIQESKLSLNFYMHEGELVQMRDTSQDLIFQKIMG